MWGEVAATGTVTDDRVRSVAFALLSRLVSSPLDAGLERTGLIPPDLSESLSALTAALPYATDFTALSTAGRAALESGDKASEREYGAIFEVGRNGPPLPIRQELLFNETTSAQKKEEIVRYYDHFAYPLSPERQWAPDHLAVALEFQHFLTFRASESSEPEPFLLAARDFSARHLRDWTTMLAQTVAYKSEDAYLKTLFAAVAAFIAADLQHLEQRLRTQEPQA